MAKSVEGFQYGEQYDTNGTKIKNGTYGKNTPFVTSDNTGILDYVIENFRVLKDGVDSKDLSIYLTIAKAQTQYQPKGNYETVEGASSKYQPKGSYLTSHQNISHLLTKTEAQSLYQPKGNYLTSHQDISHLLSKSDAQKTYETVVHSNENLQSAKSYADGKLAWTQAFNGKHTTNWGTICTLPNAWKECLAIVGRNKDNFVISVHVIRNNNNHNNIGLRFHNSDSNICYLQVSNNNVAGDTGMDNNHFFKEIYWR